MCLNVGASLADGDGDADGDGPDPKVFNPPLVGWIQKPIQIKFCGGQRQVRWIQGTVDSEIITRYSQK